LVICEVKREKGIYEPNIRKEVIEKLISYAIGEVWENSTKNP
jgi:hypothetical protein